jgi:hypothetical protein
MKITKSLCEEIVNKFVNEDKLPGGKGDNKKDSDFDPKEIKMGKKVESEHTKDPETVREIVHDHLSEKGKKHKHYYSELKKAGLADELK